MAYLTSRISASGVSLNDLIHIVKPDDLTQNPAGSSYKIAIGNYTSIFPNTYTVSNTFNPSTYDLTITRTDGVQLTTNLSILSSDMTITGGTYNNANGTATFVNNSGFSFNVTGFITGFTDNNTYVTGGTYSSGTTTLNTNSGTTVLITGYTDSPFSLINEGSGQGIVIRARNPLNYGAIGDLAFDISNSSNASNTVGATGTASFAQGSNTIASGIASVAFGSNTIAGGTVSLVSGVGGVETGYANFLTGAYNVVTGGAYATVVGQFANSVTNLISDVNNGINTMFAVGNGTATGAGTPLVRSTAFQVYRSGSILAPTLSRTLINAETTGKILVTKEYVTGLTGNGIVTGGTYTAGTAVFRNNTGGTFNVSGFSTVANDTVVTGGTYSNGTAVFRNNTGGTFNVTGFSTGGGVDVFVTGGTYTAGTATFRNITGGTFNVTGFSTAISYWSAGTGTYGISTIFGDNVASGLRSVAIGYLTTASGVSSFSQGQNTKANGDGSHAQGGTTIASGIYSHAQGNATTASGMFSHSQGQYSLASGGASHAEGDSTIASGNFSHAEGTQTKATNTGSHAEGDTTEANGSASHAGGLNSKANGQTSFVHGVNSQATGTNTIVFGSGISGTSSDTMYVDNLNIKTFTGSSSVSTLGVTSTGKVVIAEIMQKTITGSYTLLSADNDYTIIVNNGATNITITVPTLLVSKFNAGFIQQGSGTVSFVASGTTIRTPVGLKIKGVNYNAYIEKVGTTEVFHLLGNLIV